MQIIAAPSRAFKTYSMWLLIATGVFDLAVLFAKTLADAHVMTAEHLLIVNAVLAFLTGVARLVAQNIPATEEQKSDIVASAQAITVTPPKESM